MPSRWPSIAKDPEKYPITLTCDITSRNIFGGPWSAPYVVGSGGVFNIQLPFSQVVPVFGQLKLADGTVQKKLILIKTIE